MWTFGFAGLLQAADCGCSEVISFEKAYEEANIVITGSVAGHQTNPNKVGLLYTFQIDSSWKRPIEPFATIYSEYETGCGYPFRQGVKYVVFVNKGHSTLSTSICEPNSPVYLASEIFEKLGKGMRPSHSPGTENLNLVLTVMVVGGMVFLAFVVLFRRGTKKKSESNFQTKE